MATSSTFRFSTTDKPVYYVDGLTEESAAKASELLQKNHEGYHIFFNHEGFHNHLVHHLCTLFALNAKAPLIQQHYDLNTGYQRPPVPIDSEIVKDMAVPAHFTKYLGDEAYYRDYLKFFEAEIKSKGCEAVINEYLFAGDERANDLFGRLFAGFIHPILHLGFGVEFNQPAIIAESLAETAIHEDWIIPLLTESEKAAAKLRDTESPSIVELLDEICATPSLRKAADTDQNRLRDGIMAKDMQTMIDIVSKYHIKPENLTRANAEMTNAAAYFTGAAQRPEKGVKMDFYLIHSINCAIFMPPFMDATWLSTKSKIRLMEWKVRVDLILYASRGAPPLLLDEVVNYKPKHPTKGTRDPWADIIRRVCDFKDDGHAAKVVRALAHGEKICAPYEDRDEFRIKKDMWLQLGHMTIDSVEAPDGIDFVRSTGYDVAWKDVADRARL